MTTTHKVKKQAIQINKNMWRRKWCYRVLGTLLAVTIIVLLIWWIVSWFK